MNNSSANAQNRSTFIKYGSHPSEISMNWKRALLRVSLIGVLLGVLTASGGPPNSEAQNGSLAEAYKIIASKRFVDLTHSFGPKTPVWKGFGPATFSAAADPETGQPYSIAKDGFRASVYSMVGQYGTHVDAPAHFDPRGIGVGEIPLKQMILPLVVLDMTPMLKGDPNHALTVTDIQQWERQHGRVPAGSFAALRTDMYKDWEANPERFQRFPFPAWSFEAIRFLYEQRGIAANGHEALDTDTSKSMESEKWLLTHGHWQIEAMARLDEVPSTGALIVVSWPKPQHGVGFPARAFAILP